MDKRIKALVDYLGVGVEDVEEAWWYGQYGFPVFEVDGGEYLVLTDEEADKAVKEEIQQTLWAFNPDFLSGITDIPKSVFEKLSELCESANEAVLAIVEKTCGIDELVEEAVREDGRGHFLARYDGEEIEQGEFYIYRL